MSEDAILDALNAMITGFKRQTPDEWSPSDHLETRVTTKKPSIPGTLDTVGTLGTENQALHGRDREDDHRHHHDNPPPSIFLKGRASLL
jgi:hypothetical protein